jgi:hypothetical protein
MAKPIQPIQMGPTMDQMRQLQQQATQHPGAMVDPTRDTIVPPQQPRATTKLSEESVKGLEEMQRLQQQAQSQKAAAEEEEKYKKEEQDLEESIKRTVESSEIFQPDTDLPFSSENLKPLRKSIEDQLHGQPISIGDMLIGRAKQSMVLQPGLEIELHTLKGSENLLLKKLYREALDENTFFFEEFSVNLTTAASIHRINSVTWPSMDVSKSELEAVIRRRLDILSEFPIQLVALININTLWFDLRVRRALVPENLKNG